MGDTRQRMENRGRRVSNGLRNGGVGHLGGTIDSLFGRVMSYLILNKYQAHGRSACTYLCEFNRDRHGDIGGES